MNKRTAKKIITRYALAPASYPPDQVLKAHRVVGRPPKPADMAKYRQGRSLTPLDGNAMAERPPSTLESETLAIEALSVLDLKAEAKRRGLKGYSKLNKEGLVELLSE